MKSTEKISLWFGFNGKKITNGTKNNNPPTRFNLGIVIYVTLDLEGYRSGKLNQVLPQFASL